MTQIAVSRNAHFHLSNRSRHSMYRQVKLQNFYALPTQYISVLCGSEKIQRLFPYTKITETDCLLRGMDRIFNVIQVNVRL